MSNAHDIVFNYMQFLMNRSVPSSRSNCRVVALFPETMKCSSVLPFLSFLLTLAPFASKKIITFVVLAFLFKVQLLGVSYFQIGC